MGAHPVDLVGGAAVRDEAERAQGPAARRGRPRMWGAAVVSGALGLAGLMLLVAGSASAHPDGRTVSLVNVTYSNQILDIFDNHRCLDCHGAARADGGLRLHTLADTLAKPGVVVPGDYLASSLYQRVASAPTAGGHMPPHPACEGLPARPPFANADWCKDFNQNHLDALRIWISAGATDSVGSPDLSVELFLSSGPASGNVTFTAQVKNLGPGASSDTRINLKFDPSWDFVSGGSSGGACFFETAAARGAPTSRLRCEVGALANGASASVDAVMHPTRNGTFTSKAKAKAKAETDPDLSNNGRTQTTVVAGLSANRSPR
jgi:hypothetical protein